jgi:hypothetical protein
MKRFTSWLWPDRTIGKRESRQLREEHNALVNSHEELVGLLRRAHSALQTMDTSGDWIVSGLAGEIRSALAKAKIGSQTQGGQ